MSDLSGIICRGCGCEYHGEDGERQCLRDLARSQYSEQAEIQRDHKNRVAISSSQDVHEGNQTQRLAAREFEWQAWGEDGLDYVERAGEEPGG